LIDPVANAIRLSCGLYGVRGIEQIWKRCKFTIHLQSQKPNLFLSLIHHPVVAQKITVAVMENILEEAVQKADSSTLKQILITGKRSEEGNDDNLEHRKRQKINGSANEPRTRYSGWTVPTNDYTLEKVNAKDLTPELFYQKYIRQRRPVIVCGSLVTIASAGKLENWKSIDYLKSKAGDEKVVVEKRSSKNDSFGKGNEISMKFHAFLDLISKGDSMHYMTTQDVEANEDGRPDLMAQFMKKFRDDFPLRPPLMGNLIPQNINLWMGNNSDGASSGLHHDYHDNLYIVLKGKKRFRLFSPMDSEMMYTRGKLLEVHANGRINYEGEETTAYGADIKSDAAAIAAHEKEKAEEMLAKAEQEVANGVKGAQERLELAEEAMDAALEALLDAEADDEDGDENDEEDGTGLFGGNSHKIEDNQDEEDDKACEDSKQSSDDNAPRRLVDKTVKNPNNFSRVDYSLLDDSEQLKRLYPKMLNAKAAFCDIKEGQCLYLPASWFHEVKSFGGKGGHLAMNYWFHPPDATDNFDRPYTTDFWPNDFHQRLET
jgi:hypothetical protein